MHIFLSKNARNSRRILEVFLLYLFGIGVGLESLAGFISHAFFANLTAEQIGWPTGNPFQFEVAIANLAFCVLGFLCLWLRGKFWLATAIGFSIFLLGDAYGHIVQIAQHADYAPYNAGVVLYNDIFFPIVLLATLFAYWQATRKAAYIPSLS